MAEFFKKKAHCKKATRKRTVRKFLLMGPGVKFKFESFEMVTSVKRKIMEALMIKKN
jgi:hypothetical protein